VTIDNTQQRPMAGHGHPLEILLSVVLSIAVSGCSEEITPSSPTPHVETSPPPTVTAADHIRQGYEHLKAREFYKAEASFRAGGPAATGRERAEALVGLAEVMQDTGRDKDAMALVDQALTIQPNFPPALRARGYLLLAQNNYPAARSSLEAFVAQTPSDTDARYRIALICQNADEFDDAKAHLEAIVDKKDHDHRAWYQLAYTRFELKELKSAAQAIGAAIKLSPDVSSYHELACQIYSGHRPKDALPAINQAISLDPSNASAFFLRGMLYNSFATQLTSDPKALVLLEQDVPQVMKRALEKGVTTDKTTATVDVARIRDGLATLCLNDLAEAIRLTDKPAFYQLARGRLLAELGRFKDADALFIEAAKDPASCVDATLERAAVLSTLGTVQLALEVLTNIIDGPDRESRVVLPLVFLRSRLHSFRGQHQEAKHGLQTARKRFPDDVEVLLELARFESRDNLEQALKLANEALVTQPRNHVAVLLVVRCLVSQGQLPQALARLQRFIQDLSRQAGPQYQGRGQVLSECQVQLGQLYLRLGRPDPALSAFSEAIRRDKENDEAFRLRATVRLFDSDPDISAAMTDLTTATELNPVNVLAWFDQATLLFFLRSNNVSFAKEAYSTVIRLDPTFLEAYEGRVRCNKDLNAKLFAKQIQSDELMINQLRQK
jgi:tetratricopeptide (TPR) repeat protein